MEDRGISKDAIEIQKNAKCFFNNDKWWHVFDNHPFQEGDICHCKLAKIINGIVTKIV